MILQLVEIGRFERTGVSEAHEGTHPFEKEETEPICVGLGDDIHVI
jgi:hypothetical protein